MPASRSARAMTLAPRSWPSSPGFAMTTRILQHQMTAPRRIRPRRRAARRTSPRSWRRRGRRRATVPSYCGPRRGRTQRLERAVDGAAGRGVAEPRRAGPAAVPRPFVDVQNAKRLVAAADEVVDADDDAFSAIRPPAGTDRRSRRSPSAGNPRSMASTMPPMPSIVAKYASASSSRSLVSFSTKYDAAQRIDQVGHARFRRR